MMNWKDYGAVGHRCERCQEVKPLYDFHGQTLCPNCCRRILSMFRAFVQKMEFEVEEE